MINDDDNKYIYQFLSGKSLPYGEYSTEALKIILQYKKNNLMAAISVLDSIEEYAQEQKTPTTQEALNMLIDDLMEFVVDGLFGIGFYGISVEDGKPIRVDSLGKNISKQYDSVYLNMTEEEYLKLDRVESMILDQKENRKFKRYLAWYKSKVAQTLRPILYNQIERDADIEECNEIDNIFRDIARKANRYGLHSKTIKVFTIVEARQLAQELNRYINGWRKILLKDTDTIDPVPYSPTEFIQKINLSREIR